MIVFQGHADELQEAKQASNFGKCGGQLVWVAIEDINFLGRLEDVFDRTGVVYKYHLRWSESLNGGRFVFEDRAKNVIVIVVNYKLHLIID